MKELGRIITLPKIFDPRGNLTVAEGETHIPFAIARTYWTYDVPGGESRGGHASGSFSVTLDNGEQKKTYHLNHPWEGLFVDVNIWRTLDDFSSGSLCLVLASHKFEEEDYIREYDEYLRFVSSKNSQNLSKTENQ